MIPTALPIAEIATRMGGDVVAPNMARVPSPHTSDDDRSLLLTLTGSGLLVIPATTDDDFRHGRALKAAAEAHVARALREYA